MKCPKCYDSTLHPVNLEKPSSTLLQCKQCLGCWTGGDTLKQLLGESVAKQLTIPPYAMKSDHGCPSCAAPLFEYCYPHSEIQVDACKKCCHIWFDKKELSSIKARARQTRQVICESCQTLNQVNTVDAAKASCNNCGRLLRPPNDSHSPQTTRRPQIQDQKNQDRIHHRGIRQDKKVRKETPTIKYEWDDINDTELEYQYCLFALPSALLIGLIFNLTGLGHILQRIWLTMPVHELGHAITAWFTGYNAIPSLWVTQVFSDSKGFIGPIILLLGLLYFMHYAMKHNSLYGLLLTSALLVLQFFGTFIISSTTADILITFGGDGLGIILATTLMASFYYGKNTQIYKGALRWGFVGIGAAAFTDIYMVWFSALSDIGEVPYGTTGGRYTDSYKLIEFYGWSFDTLINRYFMLGNACLGILATFYIVNLRKARRIMLRYKAHEAAKN